MSEKITMPALGESVSEGTVTRWLKEIGETVEVDEPILEVSTDKVDTEIPSPVAGVLLEILVNEDEDAEVGAALAIIGDPSEAPTKDSGPSESEESSSGEDSSSDQSEATNSAASSSADYIQESAAPSAENSAASENLGEGIEIKMPALGESVTEGTISRWLKEVGESVEVDEPLLEVSTDKVDTEIPSPEAGVLLKILVAEDEQADVGSVLAIIGPEGSEVSSSESSEAPAPAKPSTEKEPEEVLTKDSAEESKPAAEPKPSPHVSASSTVSSSTNASYYVTPIVRKFAADNGIDLSNLKGSGVGGRIRKQDVQAAIDNKKAAETEAKPKAAETKAAKPVAEAADNSLRGTEVKMSRLRKIVASRMVESLQTQAQLTTTVEVDMTRIAKLRASAKDSFQAKEGAKLTFLPFIMKAAVEALKAHPVINAEIDDDIIRYHDVEHIGMAADTDRGLVVPVIKNAGDLNLAGLARQIGELGNKAKSNKLTPDDLQGATFTITNTGSGGALFDTPIVPNPQVGILGCGTIVKRPVVVADSDGNETIGIRSMMYLFLSYDHRLVDGADASRFLMTMKKRLEDGSFEGDLGL